MTDSACVMVMVMVMVMVRIRVRLKVRVRVRDDAVIGRHACGCDRKFLH